MTPEFTIFLTGYLFVVGHPGTVKIGQARGTLISKFIILISTILRERKLFNAFYTQLNPQKTVNFPPKLDWLYIWFDFLQLLVIDWVPGCPITMITE